MSNTIHLHYFSILRDESKINEETLSTTATTPSELYAELTKKYQFSLSKDQIRVAINDEFKDWDTPLNNEDVLVFIPPVSGG